MLELLNTKIFDNERNILNADLFVNNLKHTFKAFKFNTKITYEVYRNITIYHITLPHLQDKQIMCKNGT